VNFPEILRWKDLGGGTASSGAAGGGGAGGASASDFAVMDSTCCLKGYKESVFCNFSGTVFDA